MPTVFYVETEYCSELHAHIKTHVPRMQFWHEWQGCEMVYLPLYNDLSPNWDSVTDYVKYQYPILHNPIFEEILTTLKEPTHILVNQLKTNPILQELEGKAFLLYTTHISRLKDQPLQILACYQPEKNTVEEFFLQGFRKLWDIQSNSEKKSLRASIFSNYNKVFPEQDHWQLSKKSKFIFDKEKLVEEISFSSDELISKLEANEQLSDNSAFLNSLVLLLHHLGTFLPKEKKTEIQKIIAYWENFSIKKQPSRLLVDQHARIILTDFNNLEVKMNRLPKALYLFFLRHNEGLTLPELGNYKNELLSIYSKISNRGNKKEIQDSIDDLIDPWTNSINEKISKIKNAFSLIIADNEMLQNYLITGTRGGKKQILLPKELISWEFS